MEHIFKHDVLIAKSSLDDEQKNLMPLIKIFESIKKKKDDLTLVMTGDGADRDRLIEYAKNLNLKVSTFWEYNLNEDNSDIYFIGYQKNPFNLIKNSKALLLTSNYEGFPMGLIEALACDTLIISSDCPTGPSEILNGNKINDLKELDLEKNCGILLEIPKIENSNSIELWSQIIIDSLENKGYVNRESDINDARSKVLQVTVKGEELHDQIEKDLVIEMQQLIEDLDPEIRTATIQLINRLARAASERFTQKTK